MNTDFLSADEVAAKLAEVCGDGVLDSRIDQWKEGLSDTSSSHVWVRIKRPFFRAAIVRLTEIQPYPHIMVISGCDLGEQVELLYHFTIYYGVHHKEMMVTIATFLPKDDLTIPTITDLVPGALISEREKQEMLGVTVTNIPDGRRMFLPEDFPEGVYPWRRDETGPDELVKQLWETERSDDLLPPPPVPKPEAQPEPAPATAPAQTEAPPEADAPQMPPTEPVEQPEKEPAAPAKKAAKKTAKKTAKKAAKKTAKKTAAKKAPPKSKPDSDDPET